MIPIHLNPKVFKALEVLCKHSLNYGQNHRQIRDAVSGLALLLEQQVGEPCVEVIALRNLLKRTDPRFEHSSSFRSDSDPNGRPKLRLDPVYELSLGTDPKITPEQQACANSIKKIWISFSRYLSAAARNLESSGMSKGKRMDPLDVMSEDTARIWENIYTPWYEKGRYVYIGRSGMNEAEIVLKIIVEGVFPHEVDQRYGFKPGSALEALQRQLDSFVACESRTQYEYSPESVSNA